MIDLIKREDVSKMVFTEGINDNGAVYVSLHEVMYNIQNAPSVDAIPVEWLESHMITHYEVVNGDYFEDEAMELNLYVNDLIEKWREEQRKEE